MKLRASAPLTSRLPGVSEFMPLAEHGERTLLWQYDASTVTSAGTTTESTTTYLAASPTREFNLAAGASTALTVTMPADLSDATDIDVLVSVNNPSYLSSFKVEFIDDATTDTASVWLNNLLRKSHIRGEQWVRMSLAAPVVVGSPDLSGITAVRFTVSARADAPENLVVHLGQLYKVVKPYGVVFMDFDDARLSQYEAAFPIMQSYGLRGTLGVVTNAVGKSGYNLSSSVLDFMSWSQIAEVADAGWTIANHTHTHPSLASLEVADALADVETARGILHAEGYEFGSRILVTPFGSFSVALCRDPGLPASMVRWGGQTDGTTFILPFPTGNPLYQGHHSPLATESAADLIEHIDDAITTKQMVTFAFHSVLDTPGEDDLYNTTPADFDAVCAHIAQKVSEGTLRVYTREELLLGQAGPQRIAADRFVAYRGGRAFALDTTPKPA